LGKTQVCELKNGAIESYIFNPAEFGFKAEPIPTAQSKEESAKIILDVFSGKPGPARDICILNAAAAIYVGGKASSMKEGIKLAENAIDSGATIRKLGEIKEFSLIR